MSLKSALPVALACLVSLLILNWSKNIATMNQGDFYVAIDALLNKPPLDVRPYSGSEAAFVWPYTEFTVKAWNQRNASWLYLWANTKLQRLFNIHFDLSLMALLSKLIVLAGCYRISILCTQQTSLHPAAHLPLFLLFAGVCAFAHNIAFLNSFYGEHTFICFFPLALAGLLEQNRWRRLTFLTTALFFCSGAKPQYFYLAALAAVVIAAFALAGKRKIDFTLTIFLLLASAASWYYAINFVGKAANYYDSTYFGSYLLLPDGQLRQLGVKDADLECVGVDPWGNKIQRTNSLQLSHVPEGCTERIPITLNTVLAPYLKNPRLLIHLWRWAAPAHFTIHYFHVYPQTIYIVPADGKSFHRGRILMLASQLRERWITSNYLLILIAGLVFPFVPKTRTSHELKAATFLLAIFIPSQFAVCLLGEGVRDLSKHLAAAQFCLDLLTVFLILQVGMYIYIRIEKGINRRSSQAFRKR